MSRIMSKISVETVIRANKRTIQQSRSNQIHYDEIVMRTSELNVSVSVMGVVHSRTISTQQIKESFEKAINLHVKEL